jgi:hypothetical protein
MSASRLRVVIPTLVAVVVAGVSIWLWWPSATPVFARYRFAEPAGTGVLEVALRPPSICYSTQSLPARPITLIEAGEGEAVATYSPHRATFCDRTPNGVLVERLIEDPAAFLVRWSPLAGAPIAKTSLSPMGRLNGLEVVRGPFSIHRGTERAHVRASGSIRRREGRVQGQNWHVFLETSDFDTAWASVPRPGIVVTEHEINDDPVLRPLLETWRSGDDSAYRQFMEGVLDWTEDEAEPN